MSRHRNIRAMDVDEEYEGYYSCYGHSVEDDFCISPRTEAQFLYDRNASKQNVSSFIPSSDSVQEEDSAYQSSLDLATELYDSLNSLDAAKLQSCVEALQNVVGDTILESVLKQAALEADFDVEVALNYVLSENTVKSQMPKKPDNHSPPKLVSSSNISLSKPKAKHETSPNVSVMQNGFHSQKDVIKDSTPATSGEVEICDIKGGEDNEELSKPLARNIVEVYEKERGLKKPRINLVVVGHVDAGKSTLMGHLLFRLGEVSKRTMHKFEQDSKKLGKSSFMYAWVLDETAEERNRGITMDVAQSRFETKNRAVTLLDAPGHKDFIPNMITGAAQADVAVLVVDATRGEFETGFETGGQTREHTMLIRSLGVSQIAVAVNKMDNVGWVEERYNEISSKLSAFLKQAGFRESDITFVPCSGLTGENLIAQPEAQEWYQGPTLVEVIDKFNPPERLVSKPLRMCISDVFKGMTGGFCVSGRVEAGFIKTGDKVVIMPSGEQAIVKGISLNEASEQHCFAGDHAVLQLIGIDISNMTSGSMICEISRPVKVVTRFQARLVIFHITIPITKGFPVIIHYQSMSEQAIIKKLISQLHRGTGEVIRKNPRCLSRNSSAVVEIEVSSPICIELYKDFKDLGRFMLRSCGLTIAAGLVTEIL